MAQWSSLVRQHNIANSESGTAGSSPRDEFSLEGLPVGTGFDLMQVAERAGALGSE